MSLRCRFALLVVVLINFTRVVRLLQNAISSSYLITMKEPDMKDRWVFLYACALSLIKSLQEHPQLCLLHRCYCPHCRWSQSHSLTAGYQLNWVPHWLDRSTTGSSLLYILRWRLPAECLVLFWRTESCLTALPCSLAHWRTLSWSCFDIVCARSLVCG